MSVRKKKSDDKNGFDLDSYFKRNVLETLIKTRHVFNYSSANGEQV